MAATRPDRRPRPAVALVAALLALLAPVMTGCGAGLPAAPLFSTSTATQPSPTDPGDEQRFPDVVDVQVRPQGPESFDLSVTVSSPYDTAERYADGWRVVAPDGSTLAEHVLGHDHASEQPFTRTQADVSIPAGVDRVTVEARDTANGYGGQTVTVEVTHS